LILLNKSTQCTNCCLCSASWRWASSARNM
jgi:hypothetical protein